MRIVHLAASACLTIAAVATVPAWADEATADSQGSGETARSAPGGIALSRDVTPIAPLKLDDEEEMRSFSAGPAAAVEGFGVVGKSSSGEIIAQPPSEEVRRVLSGGRVMREGEDPAYADATEDTRQVFGDDDRVQITDTEPFPFKVIGFLQSQHPDGQKGACSATLIGPRTALTAAHCLYSHEKGGWLSDFIFVPGLNGIDKLPFGAYKYRTAYIFQGYISNYQGFYGSVVPWDIGIVILEEPAGDKVGWMSYGYTDQPQSFYANIVGYPGDKPLGTMWRADCDAPLELMTDLTFKYQCDTFPGSSGSAVYKYDVEKKSRVVYGVNVAENPKANTAVRINRGYFEWLRGLVE